jgi:hypothetical protein
VKRLMTGIGVLLLAGCASVVSRSYSVESGLPADQTTQLARMVLSGHRIPLLVSSTDRYAVQSAAFDPETIWGQGGLEGRVECNDPKKKKAVEKNTILMTVRAVTRARRPQTNQTRVTEFNQPQATVSLTTNGSRADGGQCSLTREYIEILLAEIGGISGKPVRMGLN